MAAKLLQQVTRIRRGETAERRVTLGAYDDREKGWRRLELAVEEAPTVPDGEEQDGERWDGLE